MNITKLEGKKMRKINKLWKVGLALLISFTSIGALISSTNLLANEEFDINETVTLNEEKTQATITLDVDNISDDYTVQSIENPDGSIMDIENNPSYIVNENVIYTFIINYKETTSSDEEGLTYSKKIEVTGIEEVTNQTETPFIGIAPMMNGGGYGVQNASSNIGGVNFVNAGSSGQLSLNAASQTIGTINVKFPANTTDGMVKVTLPPGVAWNHEGDANGLATISTRMGATMAWGESIDMIDGYHTYTVNPNVTELAITNIKINQHPRYAGRTLPSSSEVKVEVYYGGVLQDTVYINDIDLTSMGKTTSDLTPTKDYFTFLDGEITLGPDGAPGINATYFASAGVSGVGDEKAGALADKVIISVKPISLTGTGDMTKGVMTNLDPLNWSMSGPAVDGSYTFEQTNRMAWGMWGENTAPYFTITYPNTFFDLADEIKYEISSDITYMDNLSAPAVPTQNFTVKLVDQTVNLTLNQEFLKYSIDNSLDVKDLTFNAGFGNEEGSNGYLGTFYVGNRGGADSNPTQVEFEFDTTDIGVRSLRVAWPFKDDGLGNNLVTLTNVKYTTNLNPMTQTYTGSVTDLKDNSAYITWDMLGLQEGEYIKSISYELNMIPALSVARSEIGFSNGYVSIWALSYYGEIINLNQSAVNTISLRDMGSDTIIQTADLITNTADTKGTAYLWNAKNITGNTGEMITASLEVWADQTSYGSTPNPIFYIRNITDAEIDINTIELTAYDGTVIPNNELIISKYTDPLDPDAKEIIKIVTSNVTDGKAVINSQEVKRTVPDQTYGSSGQTLTWDYYIPANAQSGTYMWKDMLFIEDPATGHTISSANGVSWSTGDPYNLNSSTSGYLIGLPNTSPWYFQINGRTDMVIDNAIKYTGEADSTYTTYTQDGAHLILDAPTTVDVKMSVSNNTGVAGLVKAGTTIYMPVPKEDEDWGTLMDSSYQEFEFSTELTGPVVNPDPSRYDVFYGAVTPSDTFSALEGYSFETWNASNAANYNCIKVVQKTNWNYVSTDNKRDFVMTLKLSYNDTTDDAQMDIWRPIYHELYTANGGDYGLVQTGEYAALMTQLGQITGTLWLDDNINGVQDSSETLLPNADKSGWTVTLYELSDYQTNGSSATPVDMGNSTYSNPQTTDSTGSYFFERLDRTKEYVVVVDNLNVSKYGFSSIGSNSSTYLNNTFTGSSDQSEGVSGTSAIKVKATRLVNETGAGEANEDKNGIYPIGLRNAVAKSVSTPQDTTGAAGQVGSTITYTIHYMNTESSATDIKITDTIPTHTSYVSATGNLTTEPSVDDPAGSQIEWLVSNVPAGSTGTVTFTVKVLPTALNVSITNTAEVEIGTNSPITTNTVVTKVNATTATTPIITKSVTGNPPAPAQAFNFEIAGKTGSEPMPTTTTGTITGAGTLSPSFGSILFNSAGTYTYYIKETAGTTPGYTYDEKVYLWVVSVSADGSGNLSATTDLKVKNKDSDNDTTAVAASAVTFTNSYAVTSTTSATPDVIKDFSSTSATRPDDKNFNFTITADSSNPVSGVSGGSTIAMITGADSLSSAFGTYTFSKAGTYKFTIAELAGTDNGYTYDNETYEWIVVVEDQSSLLTVTSNTLVKVSDSSTVNEATFINEYEVVDDTYTIPTVTKTISGDTPSTDETFNFTITAVTSGAPMPSKTAITTKGAGTANFGSMTYTAAGTYVYSIQEDAGNNPGYSYSTNIYELTIVVTDNGGQLQAVGTVTKDNVNTSSIIFDNKYTHGTVSINPMITKEITGDAPTADSTFIFLMKAVSTQTPLPTDEANGFITRTISGSGQEALGEIIYTKPGIYVYEIWEDSSLQGKEYNKYTFDKTVYTMSVVVSDDGQGTLSTVVDYKDANGNDKSELVFTNSYKKSHINITFHPSSKPNNGNSNGVNSGDTTNTNFLIYTMIAMSGIIIVLRKKKHN